MHSISKNIINNKRGAALIYVMVTLVILSVFAAVIASICQANLMEAKFQENYNRAYYLALSAQDLCLAALLQEGTYGANDTLVYNEFSTAKKPIISMTRTLTDTLTLEDGVVNITVQAITVDGDRWVEIVSSAVLNSSSVTRSSTLQFQVSNPLVQIKS